MAVGCTGLHDPRGRLALGSPLLGLTGVQVIFNTQPPWTPETQEINAIPYLYTEGRRRLLGTTNNQFGSEHARLGGSLVVDDVNRNPVYDLVYIEMEQFGNIFDNSPGWGISDHDRPNTSIIGNAVPSHSFACGMDGDLLFADEADEVITNTVDGDVQMLAVDWPNRLLYFGVNGTWEIGDAEAQTGGKLLVASWTDTPRTVDMLGVTRMLVGPTLGWTSPVTPQFRPTDFAHWPFVNS